MLFRKETHELNLGLIGITQMREGGYPEAQRSWRICYNLQLILNTV